MRNKHIPGRILSSDDEEVRREMKIKNLMMAENVGFDEVRCEEAFLRLTTNELKRLVKGEDRTTIRELKKLIKGERRNE